VPPGRQAALEAARVSDHEHLACGPPLCMETSGERFAAAFPSTRAARGPVARRVGSRRHASMSTSTATPRVRVSWTAERCVAQVTTNGARASGSSRALRPALTALSVPKSRSGSTRCGSFRASSRRRPNVDDPARDRAGADDSVLAYGYEVVQRWLRRFGKVAAHIFHALLVSITCDMWVSWRLGAGVSAPGRGCSRL
jgi:hypothetical protein